MPERDWDDDDRPSWREIDKARDRSGHRAPARSGYSPAPHSAAGKRLNQQLLRQAEAAFKGKKGSREYQKLLGALRDSAGSPEFEAQAAAFHAQFGLPEDWGTLLLLLDCVDQRLAAAALEALRPLLAERSLLERNALKSKLRLLAMSSRDRALSGLAADLLELL